MREFASKAIILLILSFFLVLGYTQPALSQETKPLKIRIRLFVSGDDYYKDQVYSYIAREIRSLNDAIIVDEPGRFDIHCVVLRPQYATGEETGGIVIGTAILDNIDRNLLRVLTSGCFEDKVKGLKEWFNSTIDNVSTFQTLIINTGSEKELSEICKSIVTSFDAQYLEQARKPFMPK